MEGDYGKRGEVVVGRGEKILFLTGQESLSSNWEWEHYMQAKRCNTLFAYRSSS